MPEQNFDFTRSEQYALTLRVSNESFTFAAYNANEPQPFFFHSYPTNLQCTATANLKAILQSSEFGKHSFEKVRILLCGISHTIVPKDVFVEDEAEMLYHSCFPAVNNEEVAHIELSRHDLVMLYATDKTFAQLLKEHFPYADIMPTALPIMEFLLRRSRVGTNRKLFAWMDGKQMEVFAFTAEQFLLDNTFSHLRPEDFTYYILYAWNQLGFDQEKDELYLLGNAPGKQQIYAELQPFISHMSFLNPTTEFLRAAFCQPDVPFDVQASFLL